MERAPPCALLPGNALQLSFNIGRAHLMKRQNDRYGGIHSVGRWSRPAERSAIY